MKSFLTLAFLLSALSLNLMTETPPTNLHSQSPNPAPDGPGVLCRGEHSVVYVFRGTVDIRGIEKVENPGVVLMHANLKNGMTKWLLRSGTFVLMTRRFQFRVVRVIGVVQTETEIAVTCFDSRMHFDAPRVDPIPPGASYSVLVFRKADGVSREIKLEFPDGLPSPVPEETIESGVFKKTDKGFSVFGQAFDVSSGGVIERKQPPAK